MKDYSKIVSKLRDNNSKVDFYIHKKCTHKDVSVVLASMLYQLPDIYSDNDAHVLTCTDTCVAYRVKNEIYIIPATIKAVVNNGDDKMHLWFDYPIDMDRKDLVKY